MITTIHVKLLYFVSTYYFELPPLRSTYLAYRGKGTHARADTRTQTSVLVPPRFVSGPINMGSSAWQPRA